MKINNLCIFRKVLKRHLLTSLFALLFCTIATQSQNVTVQGTITSAEDNMPIAGATVLIKGTTTGTITDFDGNYSLGANIGDILIYSYLGFNDESVKVTGNQHNIVMSEDIEDLDEVVVIGYGTTTKKELTGAVASVKSEDLEKIVSSDLGSILQGQVAGINVVASSDPGGESEILIRGVTTLGDNTPLYVIDGIIQEGDPRINPTEIETIDILKDAASTAIYGSRGAAGVILITTKQGKEGSLQIRTNASYAIQHRNAAVPLMNSIEQTYFNVVTSRNTNGAFDDEVSLILSQNPVNFQNETDLNDLVFENNAPTKDFNTNISGGSSDITYNVSLGLFDQEGLMINSGFNRFNTRANTVYKKNKLKLQASVGLSKEVRDIPQNNLLVQTIVYNPTQPGLELDSFDDLSQGGSDVNRLGWVLETLRTTRKRKSTRNNASFKIDYDIFKELTLTGSVGLSTYNQFDKEIRPYQEIYNNQGLLQSQPVNSYIQMESAYRTSLNVDLGATYQKQLNDDHKFTGTVFVTTEKYTNEAFAARRTGVTNPEATVLDLATGEMGVSSGFDYVNKLIGTIGRIQYDYKGKYLLSSSVRVDGTSKFDEDYKWGTFPSISGAWNVSEEPFWDKISSTVNNFKLRTSHGSVGNQNIRAYQYSAGIEQNLNYIGDDGIGESLGLGASQTDFANKLLKWETTTQTNIGVDFGFLKNKLTFTAEYYYTDKENMLFPVRLPPSAGGGNNAQLTLNVGNMTNRGVELTAGYRGKVGKNIRFRMNGTFSTNENEVTKIVGQDDFIPTSDFGLVARAPFTSRVTALAVGKPAGAFYLYETDGIIDNADKLAEYQLIDAGAEMGDVIFVDNNNDGIISNLDRVYKGSGLPKYEIGYTFNANYKNFDFSMNWYAALGHEIMNGFNATAFGFGRHKDQIYQWSEANPDTTVPAFRGDSRTHPNFRGNSDLWLEDGSYLRLRSISLGMSLKQKHLKKLGFDRLRVYVRAQNPLTITDYSGYNPEIGGGIAGRGLDKGTGPTSASYLVGINFNF